MVIVVGVDGSDDAQLALAWAMEEAELRHATLVALAVLAESITPPGMVVIPASAEEFEQAEEMTEAAVEKVNDTRDTPVNVLVRVVAGVPGPELVNAGADMLIVGSRGAGGLSRLLLGSVSTHVVQHATCPVVVIPSPETEADEG
jgi:nucleotide-binding universal stress UspA family protein